MAAGAFHCFAYGTLEIPEVVRALLGFMPETAPATLRDHERFLLKGKTYPALIRSQDTETAGTLLRGLDSRAVGILDRFEDDFYERRDVWVAAGEERITAFTYVLPGTRRELLDSVPWDRQVFEQRHLEAFLNSLGGRLR